MCRISTNERAKHTIRSGDSPEVSAKNNNEHSLRIWLWDGNEVIEIGKYLNKLETSVILIQTNFIDIMGHLYQGNRNNKIFDQCYHVYKILDDLVNDLKNLRKNLNNSSSYHNRIRQLEYFFHRFMGTLIQICRGINNNDNIFS